MAARVTGVRSPIRRGDLLVVGGIAQLVGGIGANRRDWNKRFPIRSPPGYRECFGSRFDGAACIQGSGVADAGSASCFASRARGSAVLRVIERSWSRWARSTLLSHLTRSVQSMGAAARSATVDDPSVVGTVPGVDG